MGRRLIQLSGALSVGTSRLAALQDLPQAAPVLENTASAHHILKRITDLRSAAQIHEGRMNQIDRGLKSVEAEMAQLVEETGGLCPTCGSPVKPETLLNHSHSHEPSERLTA